MEKILLSIFLSNFLYSYVQTDAFPKKTTESFIVRYLEDRRIIPVRIELNTKQQTEYVRSSRGEETLYDFKQGKVAYKDANSSQCFIANIAEESLEGDRKKLRNLRYGIVRGFYLPTLFIQEEHINGTQFYEKFGALLTQFCDGNVVSTVMTQKNRKKRDTSGDKGQFTHHSYGHYGHQSNNYAHFGHETYVTGAVDKDGQIRDHRVSHQQVRSGGSHGYPSQNYGNGPHVSTTDSRMGFNSPQSQTQYQMPTHQQNFDSNGRNFGTRGSGQFSLQTAHEGGYQLNLPLGLKAGNIYRGGIRSGGHYGVGGLQPKLTTEYQKYPGSVYSETYRPTDQIVSQVPSISGAPYPSTTSAQTDRGRPTFPSYRDLDQTKLTHRLPGIPGTGFESFPTLTQPGISAPIVPTITGERRIDSSGGIRGTHITDTQIDSRTFRPSGQRQPGADVSDSESEDRKHVDQRIISNGQRISSRTDHPSLQTTALHPEPGISRPGIQSPAFQPGIGLPSMHIPGSRIQTPIGVPGQTSTGVGIPETSISEPGVQTSSFHPSISMPSMLSPGSAIQSSLGLPGHISPGTDIPLTYTNGVQRVTGISKPSYQTPSTYPDLKHQQQYIPSSGTTRQQFLQPSGVRYPTDYGINGDIGTRSQVPLLYSPGTPLGGQRSDIPGLTHIPSPVSTIPGASSILPGTITSSEESIRNGIRYPESRYPQTTISSKEEYPRGDIFPRVDGIPRDSRGTPITDVRPGDMQFSHRGTGPFPPESTRGGYQIPTMLRQGETVPVSSTRSTRVPSTDLAPRLLASDDRRIVTSQIGHEGARLYGQDSASEGARLYGQDSASSQTQIQTGIEGTAAEASSAGQYRGLGSQTQVQGGYAGNGSFSAQAQSGFTGGVVQSQVQGSNLGGLSGSSAQVERVGSAQSQVQVGQPSGAASSSAQGRFLGGTTQVQAQSGKSGGSAGAQSQSTGLSSSHVQVNIGGKDVSEQERFQGTVSASVQGGHSTGQSQTQLQGGYESGRTYVATAQGGFDSASRFQASIPPVGSLTRLSNHSLTTGQPYSAVRGQVPTSTAGGRPRVSSPDFGEPIRPGFEDRQIPQTTRLSSSDQTAGPVSTVYTHQSRRLPEQRHSQSGTLPQQQLPSSITIPQQHTSPPISHTDESRIHYPTSILGRQRPSSPIFPPTSHTGESGISYPTSILETQRPSYLPSQSVLRQPYPGYQTNLARIPTGTTDRQLVPPSSDFPSYRRYDQGGILPSSVTPGSQQISIPRTPGHQPGASQPSLYLPGTITTGFQPGINESSPYLPRLKPESPSRLSYPSSIAPSSQHSTHQQYNYTAGIPISYPDLAPQPPSTFPQSPQSTLDTRYVPSYPPSLVPQLQRPGLPTGQMTGLIPGSIPGLHAQELYPVPSFFPGQPQISPPSSQMIPSQRRPDEMPILTRPDGSHYFDPQPSVYKPSSSPGQPQIQPGQPQISPTFKVPSPGIPAPSATTDSRTGQPGVTEPDRGNCCEALRDLKRRCCGSTSKKDGTSSCCKSTSSDDIFDFSSENDLDESKGDEKCKIVKAICYIVYKPVGKARVCKPTQTNGC